jgi:hypothetical protein
MRYLQEVKSIHVHMGQLPTKIIICQVSELKKIMLYYIKFECNSNRLIVP